MNKKLAELEKTIETLLKSSGSLNEYNACITAGAIINVLKESGLLDRGSDYGNDDAISQE